MDTALLLYGVFQTTFEYQVFTDSQCFDVSSSCKDMKSSLA